MAKDSVLNSAMSEASGSGVEYEPKWCSEDERLPASSVAPGPPVTRSARADERNFLRSAEFLQGIWSMPNFSLFSETGRLDAAGQPGEEDG